MDCNATVINLFNRNCWSIQKHCHSIQIHKLNWEWEFDVENRNKNQPDAPFVWIFFHSFRSFALSHSLAFWNIFLIPWNTLYSMQYAPKLWSAPHWHHFNFQFEMAFKFELQSIVSFENSSHLHNQIVIFVEFGNIYWINKWMEWICVVNE